LSEVVGSFAFRQRGGLIVAIKSGIYDFNLESGALTALAQPESDKPDNRFNDGRCDRNGRFWAGTMCDVAREPLGSLYRLDPDGACTYHFNEIIVPNSIAWSPNNRTMYFADTYKKTIWTFDYDHEAGAVSNRRLFQDMQDRAGRPDGSAVDSEGCLWNCEYAGGRVVRYTPDGRIDQTIQMPVDNPTCCAFGGSDLRTLYVTSARQRLTPEQLAEKPLTGSVFAVRTGVSGLPEARFGA
jgi:sugar lactone lactonase YvrE